MCGGGGGGGGKYRSKNKITEEEIASYLFTFIFVASVSKYIKFLGWRYHNI